MITLSINDNLTSTIIIWCSSSSVSWTFLCCGSWLALVVLELGLHRTQTTGPCPGGQRQSSVSDLQEPPVVSVTVSVTHRKLDAAVCLPLRFWTWCFYWNMCTSLSCKKSGQCLDLFLCYFFSFLIFPSIFLFRFLESCEGQGLAGTCTWADVWRPEINLGHPRHCLPCFYDTVFQWPGAHQVS